MGRPKNNLGAMIPNWVNLQTFGEIKMKNIYKILIGLLVFGLAVGTACATTTINQFNYGVIGGSSDTTQVAVNGAVGSSGTVNQVNNLYTYDSHGVTQVAVNGLLGLLVHGPTLVMVLPPSPALPPLISTCLSRLRQEQLRFPVLVGRQPLREL